jgi:Amidohydrolase family
MAASREAGIRVIGHAPRNLGVAPMIAERQPAIAHVEEDLYASLYYQRPHDQPLPDLDGTVRTLATDTARAGSTVITTLDVYRGIPEQIDHLDRVLAQPAVACLPRAVGAQWHWWPPDNTYVRRFGRSSLPWFHDTYAMLARLTLAFAHAQVPLLAGTDTPTATMVPGFSLHDELRDLVQAGLTPYEALQAATVNPARFIGGAYDAGTIEVGRRADAVLLDANPLDDIAHTTRISGVVLHGRWLDRPALDQLLRDVTPSCRARAQ